MAVIPAFFCTFLSVDLPLVLALLWLELTLVFCFVAGMFGRLFFVVVMFYFCVSWYAVGRCRKVVTVSNH